MSLRSVWLYHHHTGKAYTEKKMNNQSREQIKKSLIEVYNKIYTDNMEQIRSGNIEIDHFLATGENDA